MMPAVSLINIMRKIPTFNEFRQCVLKEYAEIIERYSFVEQPLPDREFINQFQVRLANQTTLIIVEGISYGLDTWTKVYNLSRSLEDDYGLPIWRLINERRGVPWPQKKSKKKAGLDQLEQVAKHANYLLEYTQDILGGDFTEIDQIVERERIEQYKKELNAPSPKQRAANVAASEAGHEFKKKNYHFGKTQLDLRSMLKTFKIFLPKNPNCISNGIFSLCGHRSPI